MICETCGVKRAHYLESLKCPICVDERQYVPIEGQKWTTLEKLSMGRRFEIIERHAHLFEIRVTPEFSIGQRMFFVKTPNGGYLWDCVPLVDPAINRFFAEHGGVKGMALSHPHFYSTMKDWSQLLSIPVYVHENDAAWLGETFEGLVTWSGRKLDLTDGVTIVCAGGHFEGSSVMHVEHKSDAYLLSADTITPNPDRRSVSFMRSFPNRIPLGPTKLAGIEEAMKGYSFEKIYGAFPNTEILEDGREVFDFSISRCRTAISN